MDLLADEKYEDHHDREYRLTNFYMILVKALRANGIHPKPDTQNHFNKTQKTESMTAGGMLIPYYSPSTTSYYWILFN